MFGEKICVSDHVLLDADHVPYYLLNFEMVLRGVIDETDDGERLFLPDELKIAEVFRKTLSLDSRKLYVRLFQRKFDWIQTQSMKYDEVHDLESALASLYQVCSQT